MKSRLSHKYAFFIASLVCGVLLLGGALSIAAAYQDNKLALWNLQHEKALAAAGRFQQFIVQIEQQLRFSALPQLGERGARQRHLSLIELLNEAPAITDVALLGADGREQLFMSRLALDVYGSGRERSGDAAVRELKPGKTWYSGVYFRKQTEPYMTMALRSGPYIVVADVNLKLIWDVVSHIKIGEHGKAYVVDANGYLIADPDIAQVLKKTDLSGLAHVRAALHGKQEQAARLARDAHGKEVLSAFAPIAPTGWYLFAEQPVDEVYATVRATIVRTVILLLIGLALSIMASVLFARRMARPIGVLQAGAQRIGAGQLDQLILVQTGDELEDLAAQFNHMSGELKESYADLERKVDARTAQLQHTLAELTAAQKQLVQSEKMAALGGLVAGVAHEINTPVGVGVTAASSLQDSAAGLLALYQEGKMMKTDLEDFLQLAEQSSKMILTNLERAANLIHSFKQVAVDQSSQAARTFDVHDYFDDILRSLHPALSQTGLTVTLDCPKGIVIHSDPGALSQVVTNLVMNALAHAYDDGQAGQLKLAAALDGPRLRLQFSDDGKGIADDIIGKIFDPFFTTRRGQGGSGLGLHIVYNIITQTLHGSIECKSTFGHGTSFIIEFPVEAGHA